MTRWPKHRSSGQKNTPLTVEEHIPIEMRLSPKTAEEMNKLEEMNKEAPSEPGFTLKMYKERDNEIGFVHSVTQCNPTKQLEPVKRDTLEHFLQLPMLRFIFLSLSISTFKKIFYLCQFLSTLSTFANCCLSLSVSIYLSPYLSNLTT